MTICHQIRQIAPRVDGLIMKYGSPQLVKRASYYMISKILLEEIDNLLDTVEQPPH